MIKKINALSCREKYHLADSLAEPFGYAYLPDQDIFTSRVDAWQHEFGYSTIYDEAARHFHLIFNCLPVFFNYDGRTWRIELWKGQYGINTGAEIGVYYAERILNESELQTSFFQAAGSQHMLSFSFDLYRKGVCIATLTAKHWWLTAFSVGRFSDPKDLNMRASIAFPNPEMACCFIYGLMRAGYCSEDICLMENIVLFSFTSLVTLSPQCPCCSRLLCRLQTTIALFINRIWCRIFLFITRPFCLSLEKILYLYYYLPFCFRRTMQIGKHTTRKTKLRRLQK